MNTISSNNNPNQPLQPQKAQKAPISPPPPTSYGTYAVRAVVAGIATYFASRLVYTNSFSPAVNPGFISDALFSNQSRDCNSTLHRLQTNFFNHYESGSTSIDGLIDYPLDGATVAYLQEHNFEAIQCLIDSNKYLGDDFIKKDSSAQQRILQESFSTIAQHPNLPGTSDFIRKLIKKGMNPNTVHYRTMSTSEYVDASPLSVAVKINDKKLIKFLLNLDVSVKPRLIEDDPSPLYQFAERHFKQTNSSIAECKQDLEIHKLMLKSFKREYKKNRLDLAVGLAGNEFLPPLPQGKRLYTRTLMVETFEQLTYLYMDKIKCWEITKEAQAFVDTLSM